jgi:type IV pilus assembly protein PilB
VRTICPKCKEHYQPEEKVVKDLGIAMAKDLVFSRGKGCKNCRQTGYKGRTALFELLVLNDNIQDLIMQRAPSRMITKLAGENQGMQTLREDGVDKVLKGITTIDEVNKVSL